MKNTFANTLRNYELINVAVSTKCCDCCFTVTTEEVELGSDDVFVLGDEDQKICIHNYSQCKIKEIGVDEWVVVGDETYYLCAIK